MRSRSEQSTSEAPTDSRRPLVVSTDSVLIDELVRLAAAAGVEVAVEPDLSAARGGWAHVPLVLVDHAVLSAGPAADSVPRRESGVVLIGRDLDDHRIWRDGVSVGAEHVVFLPEAEPWLVNALGDTRGRRPGRAVVLAVVGGAGGVGATTLAAALAALAEREGRPTALIDLDPVGAGIDLVLGGETESGLRWPHLAEAAGRLNGRGLRDALPQVAGLPVLTWDRGGGTEVGHDAARAVVDAALRTFELVVIDLPRASTDAAAYACSRATELITVVPTQVNAVLAADRVLAAYRTLAAHAGLVVRSGPGGGLRAAEVATALDLPLLGELRTDPGLVADADRGVGPVRRERGALVALCRRILSEHPSPAAVVRG